MKPILLVALCLMINSCCRGEPNVEINTIETTRGFIYTYDKFGNFPHLEQFNPKELGIAVVPDSSTNTFINNGGCGEPELIYTNLIDSLNVITIYDFNADYLAGSNVNALLLGQDGLSGTYPIDVNTISSITHTYKFSKTLENDSIQLKISGRLIDKGNFTHLTDLIIIN